MMDITIHIGLHKTGTTTLQNQFFPNCTGLNYVGSSEDITHFVNTVSKQDPIYFDAENTLQLLKNELDPTKANLISRESFSGPPYAGMMEPGLDHRLSIIKNLSSVFPEAKIILVLRRQDALARSFYRQYVKLGGTCSVNKFYGLGVRSPGLFSLDRFCFTQYLDKLMETFDSGVKVLFFEEFVNNPELFLGKLCDFLSIEYQPLELQKTNYTRFGDTGLEVCRKFNILFRNKLNPGGVIPGIPVLRGGQLTIINPMKWLHEHWPGQAKSQGAITAASKTIFEGCKGDNRNLDIKYKLGIKKYGYY